MTAARRVAAQGGGRAMGEAASRLAGRQVSGIAGPGAACIGTRAVRGDVPAGARSGVAEPTVATLDGLFRIAPEAPAPLLLFPGEVA